MVMVPVIQEVVANTIDLRKFNDDDEMDAALMAKKYDKVGDKFDYLTRIPMHNINKGRVEKLLAERDVQIKELDLLEKTTVETMWLGELDVLEKEYVKYKEMRRQLLESSVVIGSNFARLSLVRTSPRTETSKNDKRCCCKGDGLRP